MNEYLDKIRQEIEKNKSDIITELDSFDVSILGNINSNISTAKNIITQLSNDNEIDFSIISSILDSMPHSINLVRWLLAIQKHIKKSMKCLKI